ncbi:MFS transporter [Kribbella solani]|uniref:MFS transporter n=1 Tax=Kribbella solani TaxID=236067 RepID=UPI0029B7C0CF|nr:MFS transporter [Kribbella solani]MDX2973300.1 MFS transporter [Kribbella solani]MDX3004492.1 MFS transporter [Kribbella solani]
MTAIKSEITSVGPWRLAALAGMASYLDAGTIVGVSASLSRWESQFGLTSWQLGFLSAALTVCIGIGAIVGGRIGDRYGRKKVYAADLLLYAFGLLWLVFASGIPMLFIGVIVVGLAIGADVPTALALVGESSPAAQRGKFVTFTGFLWGLGPLVVIVLVLLTTKYGDLMPRLIFGQFLLLAIVTWALRRRMRESVSWQQSSGRRTRVQDLFSPALLRTTVAMIAFYGLLTIGTNFYGSFGLYALETVGGLAPDRALLASLIAVPIIVITVAVMMFVMDTRARRPIFTVGAVLQVVAWLSLLVLPVTAGTLVGVFVLYGFANVLAGEAHYKLWTQENFPTTLRGTATGLSFGAARIVSAIVLVFVPTLLHGGFSTLVVLMVIVTAASGLIGATFRAHGQGEPITTIDTRLDTTN